MGRSIVINEKNCTGCRSCELVCSSSKEDQFIPERSRVRVIHNVLEGWSRPAVCLQCEDPMCMAVCPAQAITKTETPAGDRLVRLDRDKCVGCHRCMVACPVGAIDFFPKIKATKCDLCGGSPKCVEFCFYDCLRFVELPEEDREKRERQVKTLFTRASVEIAKREVLWRRQRFSAEAAAVVPPGPPREKKPIDFKVPPVTK
jgi:anaerobic carbon-monoxide dehydrogenase iron sulfur subunit